MDEPTATGISFEPPSPALPGGPWALAMTVTGSGFAARSLPLLASVGNQGVQGIFLNPDGSGFSGFLAQMPTDGDVLSIGFEKLTPTALAYHPGEVA
jgi:hypothetical protein